MDARGVQKSCCRYKSIVAKPTMSHEAFKRALAKADNNQSAFASAVGTSQQRVSYLLKHEKPCPAELVLKTEQVYGIPRHELRPDIYPEPAQAAA